MTMANRLQTYLDSEGVRYEIVAHPRTASSSRTAEAAHVPGGRVAKSVVIHHELGYVLAVVPSTHRVELSTLQAVLDKRLGLASEGEISRLFDDCDVGAVPAVGAAYGVPVILDDSLGGATDLYFEGGDHKSLIHVSGDDFRILTRDAQRARFSHPA
ncbi:aminoacyl-tRNA deacylase [Phreatobacter stygius]|uniref:Aminoacyl-tRNA deacylase n=1 Tax=Phreatobacter stygius TaxID=1940610 RepID=A0A4D7BHN8_9HYPH|nr:aminoacyl-tRNA deacylase [Phreatobacter stygius]QCI67337.1 aminoacyl-tRNA deacylase [Phreatobacter stygius]